MDLSNASALVLCVRPPYRHDGGYERHRRIRHSDEMWNEFPDLVAGVAYAQVLDWDRPIQHRIDHYTAIAAGRLATGSESELPEIQAWRRAFSAMGLKPTQHRCAAESLLRRFRKDGALPRIHPVIDLCNAMSLAFAIPVAVFDVAQITGSLTVRQASGEETYRTFSGMIEHPSPGEVVFVDEAGHAHARRWTNRQSARSAVQDRTTAVLIVAEAMHPTASADVPRLIGAIGAELAATWSTSPSTAVLSRSAPEFELVESVTGTR